VSGAAGEVDFGRPHPAPIRGSSPSRGHRGLHRVDLTDQSGSQTSVSPALRFVYRVLAVGSMALQTRHAGSFVLVQGGEGRAGAVGGAKHLAANPVPPFCPVPPRVACTFAHVVEDRTTGQTTERFPECPIGSM